VTRGKSDLPTRFGVAFALIGLAFAALWLGGVVFWGLIVITGLMMLREWADLIGASWHDRRTAQFALSVPFAAMAPIALGPHFLVLGLIAGAAFFSAAVTRNGRLGWGVLYVGVPVMALAVLREQPNGLLLTFWAMALVWACDSGAFSPAARSAAPSSRPRSAPTRPGQASSAGWSRRRCSAQRWSGCSGCRNRWPSRHRSSPCSPSSAISMKAI
jgi:phosphatidate cytidylyltransferase